MSRYAGFLANGRIDDYVNTLLFHSFSLIHLGDYQSAALKMELVDPFFSDQLKTSTQAYFFYVKGLNAIFLSDYENSLILTQKALELSVAENNMQSIMIAKRSMAFSNAMLGNCSAAYDFAVQASKVLNDLGGDRKSFIYNQISFLAVNRCLGNDFQSELYLILDFLQEVPDVIIQRYLEMATGEHYEIAEQE